MHSDTTRAAAYHLTSTQSALPRGLLVPDPGPDLDPAHVPVLVLVRGPGSFVATVAVVGTAAAAAAACPVSQPGHTHPARLAWGPVIAGSWSCCLEVGLEVGVGRRLPLPLRHQHRYQHYLRLDCWGSGRVVGIEFEGVGRMIGVVVVVGIGVAGSRRSLVVGLWIGVGKIGGFGVDVGRVAFGRGRPWGGSLLRGERRRLGRNFVVVAVGAAEVG
jgi:hypothetical protein